VISTLGTAAVLTGLAASTIGTITGVLAALRRHAGALKWTRWMAYVLMGSMVLATGLMEYALLTHDFSVKYVAEVGSRSSPVWVSVVSLWSSLDGSILLWGLVLGLYLGLFAWFTKDKYPDHTPWALAVALGVAVFFTFLIAGVANPFLPMDPVPADGPGPNALLQNHILMVIHPPTLYIGYVGMTVPFAMAAAALLAGRLDAAWSRALRRWTLVPWGALGFGIVLGGWWSYEVLGWGGWWAWDPVENASFLPWITATAYLHSAMIMERRDHLKGWTLSLVLATFLLTILGTFMTRSGVFNSVHSFTQSPIGPVFLGFLGLMGVFSLVLLATRLDKLGMPEKSLPGPASREVVFLLNNLLFATFELVVLFGTLWPLINEALNETQISVGQPYFDRMSAPIGLLIVFLMGVGPALPWGRASGQKVIQRLGVPGLVGVATMVAAVAFGLREPWPIATYGACAFALVITLRELVEPAQGRARAMNESLLTALRQVFLRARRRYGGYIVHIGVICIAVAHASAMSYGDKWHLTFPEAETKEVAGYELTYLGHAWEEQPHRSSMIANFAVSKDGASLPDMAPRLNHYKSMNQPIGTPEVYSTLSEDLYLSLVQVNEAAGTAALEVRVQPLVWWLWFGGVLMLIGTLIAAWPASKKKAPAATAPVAAAGK